MRPMTVNGSRGWNGIPAGEYYCEGSSRGINVICKDTFRTLQTMTHEAFNQAVNYGIFTLV